MSKVEALTPLAGGFITSTVFNDKLEKIEEAFQNTLSRDGSTPNQMEADLDMNTKRILNLPAPSTATEPLRKADLDALSAATLTAGTALTTSVSDTAGYFTATNVEAALQEIGHVRVDTIAALKALTAPTGKVKATVLGYYAAGDGGDFYFDSASAAADNGGTIIAPNAGAGRWKRIYSGAINVRWFGAKGDGATDDGSAINAAATFARASRVGLSFDVPESLTARYYTTVTLDLRDIRYISMKGAFVSSGVAGAQSILAGGNAANLIGADLQLRVERASIDWSAGNTGIQLSRLRDSKVRLYATKHEKGVRFLENATASLYNDFFVEEIANNKRNVEFDVSNSGAFTASQFWGGALTQFTTSPAPDHMVVYLAASGGVIGGIMWDTTDFSVASGVPASFALLGHFENSSGSANLAQISYRDIRAEATSGQDIPWFSEGGSGTQPVEATATYRSIDAHDPFIVQTALRSNRFLIAKSDLNMNDTRPVAREGFPDGIFYESNNVYYAPGRTIYSLASAAFADTFSGTIHAIGDGSLNFGTANLVIGQRYRKAAGSVFFKVRDRRPGAFTTEGSAQDIAILCWNAAGARLTGTAPYYALSRTLRETTVSGTLVYQGLGYWLWLHPDVREFMIGFSPWNSASPYVDIQLEQTHGAAVLPIENSNRAYIGAAAPTKTFLPTGFQIDGTATEGWRNTANVTNALSVAAIATDTTVTLTSAAGIASGDTIAVQLDATLNGQKTWHYTTVNGAPAGNVVTLTVAMPSAAAIGNVVRTNRWVAR